MGRRPAPVLGARVSPAARRALRNVTTWAVRAASLAILAGIVVLWLRDGGVTGMTDRLSISAEVDALLTSYPGMIAALIGTALLMLVVATSLIIVRRRLRYESWLAVHLMAYAGIVLGWFHQIPTGNDFAGNPAAVALWTALYLGTLGLLLLFRLVAPIVRNLQHRLQVVEVVDEGSGAVSLRMTGRHLDRLHARAGQFFLWRFLDRHSWWESHPFSLSAAPDGRSLRITIKGLGDFTRRAGTIAPGTRVVAEGPFGTFTDETRTRDRVALIAGGIGITPIRALVEEMSGDLVLIYRVARHEDVIFRDELETLARERGFAIHYVASDRSDTGNGSLMSAEHLRGLLPDISDREVYLCGPPAMVRAVQRSVKGAGVPSRYIHTDRFAL